MKTFKIWLEGRINQIKNALEYLDAFPELKDMSHVKKVLHLQQMGHTEQDALLLASQISSILRRNIVAQDIVAKTPDDWAVINRLNSI